MVFLSKIKKIKKLLHGKKLVTFLRQNFGVFEILTFGKIYRMLTNNIVSFELMTS